MFYCYSKEKIDLRNLAFLFHQNQSDIFSGVQELIQKSAIIHQDIKVSVRSFAAHLPSLRPEGPKDSCPGSGLGRRTVDFCVLTHSLCSTGWALLVSKWRKSSQGLQRLETQ